MFYFAWIDEYEEFSADHHARHDLDIFDLSIIESETTYPVAILRVQVSNQLWHVLIQKKWAYISYQYQDNIYPVFKGCLSVFPTNLSQQTIELELVSKPSDVEYHHKIIKEQLLNRYEYDPLFFPNCCELPSADISDLLSTTNELIDWSRLNATPQLISYFGSNDIIEFNEHHFFDSLDINIIRNPIQKIDVCITYHWTQQYQGITNIDSVLDMFLPNGVIETLTPNDFKQRWWHPGERINNSGYYIVDSALDQNNQVHYTPPIEISPHDPIIKKRGARSTPKSAQLKYFNFSSSLTVGWHYTQPRSEILKFSVYQVLPKPFGKVSDIKQLNFNFTFNQSNKKIFAWISNFMFKPGDFSIHDHRQYLCCATHQSSDYFDQDKDLWIDLGILKNQDINQALGHFFPTPRGQNIINQAIERATAILHGSTRCIEIKFQCALIAALHLSTRCRLKIYDPRLPNGSAVGKIKRLSFNVQGKTGQAYAYITLSCSIGTDSEHHSHDIINQRISENEIFEEGIYIDNPISKQELLYLDREEGHIFPNLIDAFNLVREVQIINDANEQIRILKQYEYPKSHNIDYILSQNNTKIKIELQDLRTLPRLKRRLKLNDFRINSLPSQINLER